MPQHHNRPSVINTVVYGERDVPFREYFPDYTPTEPPPPACNTVMTPPPPAETESANSVPPEMVPALASVLARFAFESDSFIKCAQRAGEDVDEMYTSNTYKDIREKAWDAAADFLLSRRAR